MRSSLANAIEQTHDDNLSTNDCPHQPNPDIVISPYDFLNETHDEDFHCQRLAAGFSSLEGRRIPIAQNDPILECLLFPDLYPPG